MRLAYGSIPLRLAPKTVAIPLVFLFLAGLGGAASLETALAEHFFFQPSTWWIPWVALALYNLALAANLHPILKLAGCPDLGATEARELAQGALKRFRHLARVSITLAMALFIVSDLLNLAVEGLAGTGGPPLLRLPVNLASGLFLGVLVHFFLENALFATKKRVRELSPGVDLPYQSLYFKIFLVLAAITVHLVVQTLSVLPSFVLVDGPESLEVFEAHGSAQWLEKNADVLFNAEKYGAKDVLEVFGLQMLVSIGFILLLLGQMKALIKKPLKTIQGRLADLNRGRPEDLCSIDVVQNDEFAEVFTEINRLIDTQQSALTASQQALVHVVAGAADPIVVFDEKGKIRVFNPAAQAFFGYTEDEAKALAFSSLVELPEEVACACETTALPLIHYLVEESSGLARHQGVHKDGTRRPFESNISTARTTEGVLYTAILRDISGQLAVEEALTKAKVAAENANRMKSEFLANMSHELRTPLNAVLGYTQLLSNDKNLTGGQLEKIQTISRSGEHLLSLINDILDISKIEAGKVEMHPVVFDLEAFVGDLRDMFLLRTQKKGLSLDVEVLEGLPRYVRGDLGKLRQVLINLVGNAVKFTNEGGIGIVVGPDGDKIRFSVNDSGKGIPESDLELILQPFTQSSNTDNEGGTGLGLTISHRFIQLMGGRLEVASQLGVGSNFAFAMPLEATEEAPGSPEPELRAVAVKEGRSVLALIVDDKSTNRLVLKEMLETVGFTTVEAENGLQAVERTREFSPRVVFMDIKMPVLDGYEAVAQIKADPALAATPVFALTASAFKHDEEHILAAGFDGFLAKPFKQSSLFRLIHDHTDIVLEYETPSSSSPGPEAAPEGPDLVFARVGEAGLKALDDMVLINDFTALGRWAESVRPDLPGFADALARRASAFDEVGVAQLIESIHPSHAPSSGPQEQP